MISLFVPLTGSANPQRLLSQISAMIHPSTTQATDHAILLTIFTIGCTSSSALRSSSSAKRRMRLRFRLGSFTKLGTCSFFSSVRITGSPFKIFTISTIFLPFLEDTLIACEGIDTTTKVSFPCLLAVPAIRQILPSVHFCEICQDHSSAR